MTRRILAFLLVLPATSLFAHEGHGSYPATQLFHYLTAPEHIVQTSLVVLAFLAVVMVQGVKVVSKKRKSGN